jgi:hypothetical protein
MVDVVMVGEGALAVEVLVRSTEVEVMRVVVPLDPGAPEVEAEDPVVLLDAVFAGPVVVVVRVTGPGVLLDETGETWTDDECDGTDTVPVLVLLDEDPDTLGCTDEEAEAEAEGDTEADGVLIGIETLGSDDEPQVFSSEKLFTSTAVPEPIASGQLITTKTSTSELISAVHCLETVVQAPAVGMLGPKSSPPSMMFTVQVVVLSSALSVWRKSKEKV